MNESKLIRDVSPGLPAVAEGDWQRPVYQVEAQTASRDGELLREFLGALRRRWWVVVLVTALCTGAVTVYLSRQPNVYEAEAQVQVDLETVNTALAASKSGALSLNPVNDPAYFNTQLQILTRPSLLRRVVKTLNLENDAAFRAAQSSERPSLLRRITGGSSR